MKYAYRNAHLLDGTRDMLPRDGLAVLTDGETIAGIVPEEAIPAGFESVDLGGKYLMPGLINLHVHLAGNGKPQKKQRDNEKLVRRLMGTGLSRAVAYHVVADFARLEVMSGVTTIRTVGGLGDFDTRLRDEIASGVRVGPRILAANEGISVPGGHMAGSVAVAAEDIPQALRQGQGRPRGAEDAAGDGEGRLRPGPQSGLSRGGPCGVHRGRPGGPGERRGLHRARREAG